jgi:SAM-dependent methyltransferase
MPNYMSTYYPESNFGGFTDIDGSIIFYTRVNSFIERSSVLLDVGCGRGAYAEDPVSVRRDLRLFKGRCERVIGIDVGAAAGSNPWIDEFRRIEGDRWPLEDESVDVCVSDWVLEHVDRPEAFFRECRRVVKPGGYLCLRTANARSYVGFFSRLIPNRFHAAVVRRVQEGRKEEDVFPTVYRCNTKGKIKAMLDDHGFDHCVYEYESEPYYLSFNRLFYFLGVTHQRFALPMFKPGIFAFAKKRAAAGRR